MAKRGIEQGPHKPHSSLRVRWVEVELNGSDTSIEEALRTVERMRRPVIEAPAASKRISSTVTPTNGDNATSEDPTLFDQSDGAQTDSLNLEPASEVNSDTTDVGERKKRGEGKPQDRNAGVKLVGDIDFVPNGKQSLKDLFAEKRPGSDMDQILVICFFLQHILGSPQIGPGHILSGFKHVGEPVPKALKQTIRNMKEKKAWLNFSDIESVRLTTEGDNQVQYELGKTNGESGAD